MWKFALFFVAVTAFQAVSAQSQTPTPALTLAQLELIKQQNTRATLINSLITAYTNAFIAKNWQGAIDAAKQLVAIERQPRYYYALGDAQLNQGSNAEAAASYSAGLPLAGKPEDLKKGDQKLRATTAAAMTNLGNAYLMLKKNDEALKSYELAADLDPNPGVAYFNLCATQYNLGNVDPALAACNKSLAVDPKRADAWFIKGSLLFADANTDANGKMIPPAGTVDALKKYLELAPTGPHAGDVKEMLNYLGVHY